MQQNERNKKATKDLGGRPRKAPEDRKTIQLKIWVTPAEAAEIKQKAKAEGFKRAGRYMAKLVLDGVRGTAPVIHLNPRDMRQISQVGNNLNHIARHLKSGCEFDQEMLQHVLSARNTTKNLWQEITRLKIKNSQGATK